MENVNVSHNIPIEKRYLGALLDGQEVAIVRVTCRRTLCSNFFACVTSHLWG